MCRYTAIVAACLVLLSTAQTGDAINCDFCYGEEDCSLGKDVPVVTCDEESVQLTNNSLASFIRSLSMALPTLRNNYECVHVRATSMSGHVFLFIRGCAHRLQGAGHFCSLPHAAFQGSLECMACDGEDRCNNIPVLKDGEGSGATKASRSLIVLMITSLGLAFTARIATPFS